LFHNFLEEFNSIKEIEPELFEIFSNYSWPGNVRELRNIAEYLAFMSEEKISVAALPYTFCRTLSQNNETYHMEDHQLEILKILKEKLENKEKVGRVTLMKLLEKKSIYLTEREVRKEMNELKNKGYIAIGKGKQGSKITSKGIEILSLQSF